MTREEIAEEFAALVPDPWERLRRAGLMRAAKITDFYARKEHRELERCIAKSATTGKRCARKAIVGRACCALHVFDRGR